MLKYIHSSLNSKVQDFWMACTGKLIASARQKLSRPGKMALRAKAAFEKRAFCKVASWCLCYLSTYLLIIYLPIRHLSTYICLSSCLSLQVQIIIHINICVYMYITVGPREGPSEQPSLDLSSLTTILAHARLKPLSQSANYNEASV